MILFTMKHLARKGLTNNVYDYIIWRNKNEIDLVSSGYKLTIRDLFQPTKCIIPSCDAITCHK